MSAKGESRRTQGPLATKLGAVQSRVGIQMSQGPPGVCTEGGYANSGALETTQTSFPRALCYRACQCRIMQL